MLAENFVTYLRTPNESSAKSAPQISDFFGEIGDLQGQVVVIVVKARFDGLLECPWLAQTGGF
jgi:hypothetical protein